MSRYIVIPVPSEERRAEFDQIRSSVSSWAAAEPSIAAAALVGSWARGEPRCDSDMDIVLLTLDVAKFVQSSDWLEPALSRPAEIVRTRNWGRLTERRARVQSGFEIEFGVVHPAWASTNPVDPGTRRVVADGCVVLYEDQCLLSQLIETVSRTKS